MDDKSIAAYEALKESVDEVSNIFDDLFSSLCDLREELETLIKCVDKVKSCMNGGNKDEV